MLETFDVTSEAAQEQPFLIPSGDDPLGLESAGVLMSVEEFEAIEDYDEAYCYELVNGVLIVNPIPLPVESGPNDILGQLLRNYKDDHPQGSALDLTLPQQYIRLPNSRRIADRVIWTGLGRLPNHRLDIPTIAVEFVSKGSRSRKRDYVDKRRNYAEAGVSEYWIIDRFQRTLTVVGYRLPEQADLTIAEKEAYQSPLLPGFEVPLARLLASADQLAEFD